jgi:hypothetical protein
MVHRVHRQFAALLFATACGGASAVECLTDPCAQPAALRVTVTTSTSSAGVAGTVVKSSGVTSSTVPCDGGGTSPCSVFGGSGTYQLTISAPGYLTVHRTVIVTGTRPACGCEVVEQQAVSVTLVAAA